MTTFKTATRGILASVSLLALTLGGCATPAMLGGPAPASATQSGSLPYGISVFPGIRALNGWEGLPPAQFTLTEYTWLQDFDKACHTQMDPQIPGFINQVFLPTGKLAISTGIGGAVGTGAGAVAGFPGVSFADYLRYGGLAAAGSAAGSGFYTYSDRYQLAKNYVQYGCMTAALNEAHRRGYMRGIDAIPWAGVGYMKGIPVPTGLPSRGDTVEVPATSAAPEDEDDPGALPPPPIL